MSKSEILRNLRKATVARDKATEARELHAEAVRGLIRAAHAADIGVSQIARQAGLSRQAVYEALREKPSPRR